MTTNQEGLHATVRALTSTTRSYNEDWHALFDADGITAGPFNARMLAWINATLGTSYTNLNGAMQAFAVDQGFANWASMNTFVTTLAASFLSRYGPYGMVMDFTDASIKIDDSTGVLDYSSQGTVSSTTGALAGPGSKLTNTAPSVKLTEQADGYLSFQAHNLALQSENLATTWAPTRTTVASAGTPPTGSSASFSVTVDTSSGTQKYVQQAVSVLTGATYMVEMFLQAGTWNFAGLYDPGSTQGIWFNLSTGATAGTAGMTAPVSSSITSLGGGWYHCSMEFVAAGGTATVRVYPSSDAAALASNSAGQLALYWSRGSVRRTPSVSTYVATTSAAVYDLPYVYSAGVKTGVMVEPAATNLCLRSNDFTNASWTKSNMTTALTATGPDGVANSASTLTATAGNATALQAITSASSSRLTHCYIKRRTGSGNIDLTQDNGTTWATQTVTSAWTRVALAAVTSTDPTIGIRIVTSGDAVDVAYFQHEPGTVATSPIITYGAAVTRAIDNLSLSPSLFPSLEVAGTLYAEYFQPAGYVYGALLSYRISNNDMFEISTGSTTTTRPRGQVATASVPQMAIELAQSAYVAGTVVKAAAAATANSGNVSGAGLIGTDDTSITMPTGITALGVGGRLTTFPLTGVLKVVAAFPERKANATLQTMTTA